MALRFIALSTKWLGPDGALYSTALAPNGSRRIIGGEQELELDPNRMWLAAGVPADEFDGDADVGDYAINRATEELYVNVGTKDVNVWGGPIATPTGNPV